MLKGMIGDDLVTLETVKEIHCCNAKDNLSA